MSPESAPSGDWTGNSRFSMWLYDDGGVLSPLLQNDLFAGPPWCSTALVGDTPIVTVYDQSYMLDENDEVVPLDLPFPSGVSETRVWEGRNGPRVGVCLPERGEIQVGDVPLTLVDLWPSLLSRSTNAVTNAAGDFLGYPLSLDGGPDGRIFVLDVENARVVVFDSALGYITQWGRWGRGSGEFDFGGNSKTYSDYRDFSGSIAVDADGFVYVADDRNNRIQKFAAD